MRPRLLLAAAAAVILLALSGCVSLLAGNPIAGQLDLIGKVEIESTFCATDIGEQNHPGCDTGDTRSNNGTEGMTNSTVQVLVGYRVPAGSSGPLQFTTDIAPAPLTFRSSGSYSSELERIAPAGPGAQWIGYISDEFAYNAVSAEAADHRATITPEFTLPQGGAGVPFQSPFRYQVVVGGRDVGDPSADPSTPVVCSDIPGQGTFTQCITSPAAAEVSDSFEEPVRDLALAPETPISIEVGKAQRVELTAHWEGAAAPDAFELKALTEAPGVTVAPASASAVLGSAPDAVTSVPVDVTVPSSTPPGTYTLQLIASLPNGQARTVTRPFTVAPPAATPDTSAPKAKAAVVRGQSVRSLLRRGLRLRVSADEPGRVALTLRAGKRKIAAKTVVLGGAGSKAVALKLDKKARSKEVRTALLKPAKLKLALQAVATDRAGNSRKTVKRFRLKRGKG